MLKVIPYNTEKSNNMSKEGYYAFKVSDTSNKIEIKNFIKYMYGLDVIEVKVINTAKKDKFTNKGKVVKKATFKKVYVKFPKDTKFDPIKFVK